MGDRNHQSANQTKDQQAVQQPDPGSAERVEIVHGIHGHDRIQDFTVSFVVLFPAIRKGDGNRYILESVGAILMAALAVPDRQGLDCQTVCIDTGADFHSSAERDVGCLSFMTCLSDEVPEFQRIEAVTGGIDFTNSIVEFGSILAAPDRHLCQVVIQLQVDPAFRHRRVASCAGNDVEVQAGIRQPLLVCQEGAIMAAEAR